MASRWSSWRSWPWSCPRSRGGSGRFAPRRTARRSRPRTCWRPGRRWRSTTSPPRPTSPSSTRGWPQPTRRSTTSGRPAASRWRATQRPRMRACLPRPPGDRPVPPPGRSVTVHARRPPTPSRRTTTRCSPGRGPTSPRSRRTSRPTGRTALRAPSWPPSRGPRLTRGPPGWPRSLWRSSRSGWADSCSPSLPTPIGRPTPHAGCSVSASPVWRRAACWQRRYSCPDSSPAVTSIERTGWHSPRAPRPRRPPWPGASARRRSAPPTTRWQSTAGTHPRTPCAWRPGCVATTMLGSSRPCLRTTWSGPPSRTPSGPRRWPIPAPAPRT